MKIACVGNALYDIIAFVESDFASCFGLHPGSALHTTREYLLPVLEALPSTGIIPAGGNPGGGALNTARAFASLGHEASFSGMIGTDLYARHFEQELLASTIVPFLQRSSMPTGIFCALVARDGSKTIVVAPEAAPHLNAQAIPDEFFDPSAVLYIDGFVASNPDTLRTLVERGTRAGMRIALDVASSRLAAARRDYINPIIRNSCSWTFMNEDEFMALAESGVDEALSRFSSGMQGQIIVKRAEFGAVCVSNGVIIESAVRPIQAQDTTGAGDAFAAGFLSAALSGESLPRCLRLGNRVAEYSIQKGLAHTGTTEYRRAAQAVI